MNDTADHQHTKPRPSLRNRAFEVLDGGWETDPLGRFINVFMVGLIVLNVAAIILESMQSVGDRYASWFDWFELFSVVVFSVEYLARVWCCVDHPTGRYAQPIRGRLRYMASPMAIIDLMAVAPFFINYLVPTIDLRFLRVFRLLRLLKLTRYFPAMRYLGSVVYGQRRALLSAFFVMLVMLTFASSLMYLIEHKHQPEDFSSIPAAMWWGMATLTTVGYGDVTPITPMGKLVGTMIALFGIGMFALPAAIMASGFIREMEKLTFITSWKVTARLPLFKGLDAAEIGEVATLLRPRNVVPGEAVFRKGDYASGVFFIITGRIRILLDGEEYLLKDGDFFGEIALLDHRTRLGTAIADASSRLLELDREDFDELCERDPQIHANVARVAQRRLESHEQGHGFSIPDNPE